MGIRKPEFTSSISTISSGINFDELLDYVTMNNYDVDNVEEETYEEETQETKAKPYEQWFKRNQTKTMTQKLQILIMTESPKQNMIRKVKKRSQVY